jgi:hypothetical protein
MTANHKVLLHSQPNNDCKRRAKQLQAATQKIGAAAQLAGGEEVVVLAGQTAMSH